MINNDPFLTTHNGLGTRLGDVVMNQSQSGDRKSIYHPLFGRNRDRIIPSLLPITDAQKELRNLDRVSLFGNSIIIAKKFEAAIV